MTKDARINGRGPTMEYSRNGAASGTAGLGARLCEPQHVRTSGCAWLTSMGARGAKLLRVADPRAFVLCVLVPVFLLGLLFSAEGQGGKHPAASVWERSIVTLEVARKQYDYYQPWSRRTKTLQKAGTVVGERQILTTAEDLWDRTLVRLQKHGGGTWSIGEVIWVDYHANLALVTTSDAGFWRDLKPATLGGFVPREGALEILRWREGNLENRRAEFTQFVVREGQLSPINQVQIEAGSEIQGAGWGEPLISGSRVVGLVRAQDGRTCVATPASFIESVLEAHRKGNYRGLGFFHFFWQPAENPASLARLKLPGPARGVIVDNVPDRSDGGEQVLKRQDILTRIDGFDLDIQGDYEDPEFGHVLLENLAVRRKWAGDDVKMQIWRDGRSMDVTYRLPKFQYTNSLVPYANYDREPQYLIVGGLVFQPLTDSYLQSWGADWKRRAPFRLNYYNFAPPTKERPALVLLSQVLADPYNIGYQEQNYLVVDKVNGQRVSHLSELREALQKPVNGFHILEFMAGDSVHKMVLAAGEAEQAATGRVLKRYGITESTVIGDW